MKKGGWFLKQDSIGLSRNEGCFGAKASGRGKRQLDKLDAKDLKSEEGDRMTE